MNLREFEVSFSKYFKPLDVPKRCTKERTAEEMLLQHLGKAPRASAEVAEKNAKIVELRTAMESMQHDMARAVLQEKIMELESQIKAIPLGEGQARAIADKKAYADAATKIKAELTTKAMLRDKKIAEAEKNSEEFEAALAEMRVRLAQVESDFGDRRKKARETYAAINEAYDETAQKAIRLAEQRVAENDKILSQKATQPTPKASPAAGAEQDARDIAAAANVPVPRDQQNSAVSSATDTKGQTNAVQVVQVPKWYQQKTHYVPVEPKNLANVQELDWDKIDMEELHRGWHVLQAIQMQPPNLAFTYKIFGMEPTTVETLLGTEAFSKIFGGSSAGNAVAIAPEDVVPDQVINLLRVQLQKLSNRLQEENKEAVEAANKLVEKYLPSLKQERDNRGASPY